MIWCQPLQDVLNEPVEGWQETMRNLKVIAALWLWLFKFAVSLFFPFFGRCSGFFGRWGGFVRRCGGGIDWQLRENILSIFDVSDVSGRFRACLGVLDNFQAFWAPLAKVSATPVKLREVQIEEGLWDNTIDHLKPTDLEYKGQSLLLRDRYTFNRVQKDLKSSWTHSKRLELIEGVSKPLRGLAYFASYLNGGRRPSHN